MVLNGPELHPTGLNKPEFTVCPYVDSIITDSMRTSYNLWGKVLLFGLMSYSYNESFLDIAVTGHKLHP
jgi:hypothetical protein